MNLDSTILIKPPFETLKLQVAVSTHGDPNDKVQMITDRLKMRSSLVHINWGPVFSCCGVFILHFAFFSTTPIFILLRETFPETWLAKTNTFDYTFASEITQRLYGRQDQQFWFDEHQGTTRNQSPGSATNQLSRSRQIIVYEGGLKEVKTTVSFLS